MHNIVGEEIRITGLQPDKGVFKSLRHALSAFLSHPEGWVRHEEGYIVFHQEDCTFAASEADDCICQPMMVMMMQGEKKH